MTEYNLSHEIICKEISALDVTNYSSTDKDYNRNKPGDVCLSFQSKQFDLRYPYN